MLKTDLFGHIYRLDHPQSDDEVRPIVIERDLTKARWWTRSLARLLARREARALAALPSHDGLPSLISWDQSVLQRSFVSGQPMQAVKPRDPAYFRSARQLLRALHRAGVVHNDSAKEPNWLVRPDGTAGLVDYQLAGVFEQRTKLFRTLAMEDIRHLLKHKRSYLPHELTAREKRILATPAPHARLWRKTGKRLYLLITRRLLRWSDREGANDRQL